MATENLAHTAPRHAHPVYRDCDHQLLIRLRENEIDLQMLVNDLSDEIRTREEQLIEAMRQLRTCRDQMRQYLGHIEWDGSAA